jgi:hypothetical protein
MIPKSEDTEIFTRYMNDDKIYINNYTELVENNGKDAVLSLLKADDLKGLTTIKEIQL